MPVRPAETAKLHRKAIEINMELQVGVKAILKNKEGRILLLKRSPEKYPEVKNPWDIVGGRIVPGSGLAENLKREIKEETGLEMLGEPKLMAAQDILRLPERHIVRLTYMAGTAGEPVLNNEHSEFGWFLPEEIKHKEGVDEFFKEIIYALYNNL